MTSQEFPAVEQRVREQSLQNWVVATEGKAERISWEKFMVDPFSQLLEAHPELARSKEVMQLRDWYRERVGVLPEFRVVETGLQSNDWVPVMYNLIDDNETVGPFEEPTPRLWSVVRPDGKFFEIIGVECTKRDEAGNILQRWRQPTIWYKEVDTEIELYDKKLTVPVFGLLAVVKDEQGRMLMTLGQEVTSDNPGAAVFKLPVQASSGNMALIEQGRGDPNLIDFLKRYCQGSFKKLIDMAKKILPLATEDTNRDWKHNLALLLLPVVNSTSELHQELVADGSRIWLTELQWDVICLLRLTNGHTQACIGLDEAYHKVMAEVARLREQR